MKTLKILLIIAAVMISGFSKDTQTDGTKDGVVVPFKFWGGTIPNLAGGLTVCTPVEYGAAIVRLGLMQGHQTHGGKLIPELSPWEITSCISNGTESISQAQGTITVANGDSYNYSGIMVINPSTRTVSATGNVTGGVGRFEGVTGEFTLNGTLGDYAVVTWSGEGFLTFPK